MTRWDWNPQLPRDGTGIYEFTKDLIERGMLVGEQQLTIDDIQDEFGTNRATAAKAHKMLRQADYVVHRRERNCDVVTPGRRNITLLLGEFRAQQMLDAGCGELEEKDWATVLALAEGLVKRTRVRRLNP